MAYKKVLIDTNICLDVVLNREPFAAQAAEIIDRCEKGQFKGMISAHSFDTIYYVLAKEIGRDKAQLAVQLLRKVFAVADVTQQIIDQAIADNWTDLEDAIHYRAALRASCQAIVTRNVNDFKEATIPVLMPDQFISELQRR